MSINLNHSIYGAQFSAFRDLASQANLAQDTLVSIDEAGRGKGLLNEAGERRPRCRTTGRPTAPGSIR